MSREADPLRIPKILEDTPSLLRTVTEGFADQTLQWTPNPERWSAAMVLAHLADAEVTCFQTRLKRIATEDLPVLEPYDQWAFLRAQSKFPAGESLEKLQRERQATLAFLRTLSSGVLTRTCQHQQLGPLTFEHLLNEFAFHDMGHIRQILELCRAHTYYPQMGGWQQYYTVNP